MFSNVLLFMDTPMLTDQKRLTYISFVKTLDAILEDLPEAIDDGDGWLEKVKGILALSTT